MHFYHAELYDVVVQNHKYDEQQTTSNSKEVSK